MPFLNSIQIAYFDFAVVMTINMLEQLPSETSIEYIAERHCRAVDIYG